MGNLYGYARVSTRVQNEARQLNALRAFGVADEKIVIEKQSGKNFNRPLYRMLVKRLHCGDVLVIQSIDRLGRDYTEIREQWQYIMQKRKANIVVLDMPLLDTREREGSDLTGKFVADLVLQILCYVAEREHVMIRQRQSEGIAAAMERGVQFGRKPKVLPDEFCDLAVRWRDGEVSSRDAAWELGISHTNFIQKAKQYCEN